MRPCMEFSNDRDLAVFFYSGQAWFACVLPQILRYTLIRTQQNSIFLRMVIRSLLAVMKCTTLFMGELDEAVCLGVRIDAHIGDD